MNPKSGLLITVVAAAVVFSVIPFHSAAPSQELVPDVDFPQVTDLIRQYLTSDEARQLRDFFGSDQPPPGPLSAGNREQTGLPVIFRATSGSRQQVQLSSEMMDGEIIGTGTRNDPYQGLISAAIANLDDPNIILEIPEGYYQDVGIDLPVGLYVVGQEGAVILAPEDPGESGFMFRVPGHGGIIGLVLDGSAVEADLERGWRHLSGVILHGDASRQVVAGNIIRDIPGHGVYGRDKGGTVTHNIIDRVGFSGIRTGSDWLVANNRIRHAGILRGGDGGLGDDAIIVSGGNANTRIIHNLIIAERKPNGRHGIATHNADHNLIQNNVIVSFGELRGGIRLSDRSNHNIIQRNLILGVRDEGGHIGWTILVNGSQNKVLDNAVYGRHGIATGSWPMNSHNVFTGNRIRTTHGQLDRGTFGVENNNDAAEFEALKAF